MALLEAVVAGALGAMIMWTAMHLPNETRLWGHTISTMIAGIAGVAVGCVAWRILIARGNALLTQEARKTAPERVGYAP